MKILHINTYDQGGAAKACIRLHEGLLDMGADSRVLFLRTTDPAVAQSSQFVPRQRRRIGEFFSNRAFKRYEREKNEILENKAPGFEVYSFPDTLYTIQESPLYQEADIINLHWTARFLDYRSFFRDNRKKIVWTMHDMNPFSGGCHYPGDCRGYTADCRNCPQLEGTRNTNYSHINLKIKLAAMHKGDLDLHIVALSEWLKEASQGSSLFRSFPHSLIPNGLDSARFKLLDKRFSRELLSLPEDKKAVFFIADDINNVRKGYRYLLEAFELLAPAKDYILCTIGQGLSGRARDGRIYELGYIRDERLMSAAYSAADVFVLPSLEDNLPNTVVEAMMCGAPVIGFPVTGVKEMIDHNVTGLLCEEVSSAALASEIRKILEETVLFSAGRIREKTEKRYDSGAQSKRYLELYEEILKG